MTILHSDIQMAITHGLHLLPVKPKDKVPLLPDWPNRATSDETTIREWLDGFPGRNVGIATGLISGVVVLDVDPRHGGDEALANLPELPMTWTCHTGGGGRHLYFRHPGVGAINNSAGVVGAGLDIRGDGGFVVAPPSIHANGRPYAWDVDGHPDEIVLADLPAWILAKIDRLHVVAKSLDGRAVVGEVAEGKRNARLASLAGHLLRRRCDPHIVLAVLLGWNMRSCKPPLEETEVTATVTSIINLKAARREASNAA